MGGAAAVAAGYDLAVYPVIDSTNEEAKRRAAFAHDRGLAIRPTWIRADAQSAGRGRRGREWVSANGNLFTTLLLNPAVEPAEAANISFVTALAVSDCVAHFAPDQDVKVKWPNDTLLNGGKVSGVLLETCAGGGLAVGIGVNLAHHPDPEKVEFPPTSIASAIGDGPDPAVALGVLSERFDHWLTLWRDGGFAPIREVWLARAAKLGERIRIRLQDREFHAIFRDMDHDGALLVEKDDGSVERVTAGDIFLI